MYEFTIAKATRDRQKIPKVLYYVQKYMCIKKVKSTKE